MRWYTTAGTYRSVSIISRSGTAATYKRLRTRWTGSAVDPGIHCGSASARVATDSAVPGPGSSVEGAIGVMTPASGGRRSNVRSESMSRCDTASHDVGCGREESGLAVASARGGAAAVATRVDGEPADTSADGARNV